MEADIKTKLMHLIVALAIVISLFSGALPVSAATPPTITTDPATSITLNSAVLNGNLTSLGTATTVNVSFDYGTTIGYGSTTPTQILTVPGAFTATITGLIPGTLYHFQAKANGGVHGTANGLDATFTTRTTPTVTTNAAASVTVNSAVLNGNLTALNSTGTVNVSFEYGTTTSYGSTTSTQAVTIIGPFTATITGLSSGILYHFRAKADGGVDGVANGADLTFTTTLTPPVVNTVPATSVAALSATLNGNLTSLGSAATVNVSFEYGLTTGYGSTTTPQAMTTTGSFTASLITLSPGTLYHFRAKADGGAHGTATGSDMTFTTLPPPTVTTGAATDITFVGATLNGNLTSLGTATTVSVFFEYGGTTTYDGGQTTSQTMTATGPFSATVTGLSSGTLYHFRARAITSVGASSGADMTFTTTPTPPTVITSPADVITPVGANLNGDLTALGSATTVNVSFEYGTTTAYGFATTTQAKTATGTFTISVTGLIPGTLYHFRAKADGTGGTAEGVDLMFTTLAATPPGVNTSSSTSVTSSSVILYGDLTSRGTASTVNVSFEYGAGPGPFPPYASETTVQTMTAIGPFTASITGLNPGTLYHFRAKADGGLHGTVTGGDMTFSTLTPIAPIVSTSPATSITSNSVALTGILGNMGTASPVNVSFEYGTTTGYGSTTPVQVKTATGTFTASISGLNPGTLYHFRAKADGGLHGLTTGVDMEFTTLTPPAVTTNAATGVTINSATLNGNLTALGTASPVNVSFEYGTTTSYGFTSPTQAKTATGVFTANITGLNTGTLYHFRAKADGGAHGTVYGADMALTTATPVPPMVSTAAAGSVTSNSAALNGNLTSLGTATTVNVSFEYGATTSYGFTTTAQPLTAAGALTASVASLTPGTLYHFRARADGLAHGAALGADLTFTTLTTPAVTTNAATGITSSGATLNGNLTSLGTAVTVDVSFEYGTTLAYGSTTTVQALVAPGLFTATITGLSPGTLYHFRAKVDGGLSGSSTGSDMTFTTIRDPPVVITSPATGVTDTAATLNGNLTSLGTAGTVYVSFEYGTTIVYGSTAPLLPQAMTTTGVFTANITGLTPSTLYHFRAKADGGVHGTANGLDATFTTLAAGGVPAGPGGGGGGGGGGGASLAIGFTGKNGYRTSGSINALGVVQGNINGYSTDGVLMLALPAGTYALDKNGRPLSGLNMAPESRQVGTPTPAKGTAFIGSAYNCQPDGATFNPSVILTWNYKLEELPKGVSEKDIFIGYWDENTGRWVTLKGIVIDTELHTFSVPVSHFTTFAMFYKIPAILEYGSLNIVPAETTVGQNVNISVVVSNSGGATGNGKLVLLVNGVEEAMKEVTVEAGASQEISFSVTKKTAGTYKVDVNGLAGSFVLKEKVIQPTAPTPASLAILNLSISPEIIRSGENVTISVVVANSGGTAGPYSVVLTINGVTEGKKEVTVLPGKTQKVDFVVVKKNPGTYQVEINTFVSSFVVKKKALTSWSWLTIGGIMVLVAALALLLVSRRRKREIIAVVTSPAEERNKPEIILKTPEDYNVAILDCTRAIARNPDSSSAYNERGVLFLRKGAYDDAIRDYTQAIKLNPGTPFVYRDRGVSYSRKREYDQALADLSMGLRIFPGDTEAYYERGMVYKSLGQKFLATVDFNTVITLRPDSSLRKKAEQALVELQ